LTSGGGILASLYLHIPFCEKKCLYCDFYSIENRDPMEAFLAALEREIAAAAARGAGRTFDTVFFGGGTPSLLTPPQLEAILRRLHDTFAIAPGAELTLETNPGTVAPEKLAAYRSLGVNRLSIGIQSFRAEELRFLSRIHDAEQASACVAMARAAGFDNVSVDLIYALPGQTRDAWRESLSRALDLAPEHLSAYSLIVEPGTPLFRLVDAGEVTPARPGTEADLYEYTMDVMARAGYEHYEVSNYARPGKRSRHNYAYWSHEDYLGFGPSAHSFWKEGGGARRWSNTAQISSYIENCTRPGGTPVGFREDVGVEELINERIFLGLRSDGVDTERFQADFGRAFPPDRIRLAEELAAQGKLCWEGGTMRLTAAGFLLCDEIAARMMI
jgi:oxygen-independent coproporphyrinogen III oxidase